MFLELNNLIYESFLHTKVSTFCRGKYSADIKYSFLKMAELENEYTPLQRQHTHKKCPAEKHFFLKTTRSRKWIILHVSNQEFNDEQNTLIYLLIPPLNTKIETNG